MSFNYNIASQNKADITITLSGRLLEKSQAKDLLDKINELFDTETNLKNITLDLSKLDYLNSSGLNVLIQILTIARNHNGEVYLININPEIEKLLIITKLHSIFKTKNSTKK